VTLWRISRHAALDGAGGLRGSARWHTRGRPIVYCAPNPATALVEILVHAEIDAEDMPVDLRCLEIEAAEGIPVEDVDVRALGRRWRTDLAATRRTGDEWLRSGRTPLLRAPSAIVPATWNTLINPEHPESARIRVVRTHAQRLDERLFR